MNLRTTIFLIVLVALAAGGWVWFVQRQERTADPTSETVVFLSEALKPDKITRIEAQRGKTTLFTLERNGQEWSLPGTWPIRAQETDAWLKVLTTLHSRFAPTPITKDTDLTRFGLTDDSLTIKVTDGNTTHTLRFGEEASDLNRFTRATYVRLDDKPEVVRLGPGIIAALDRKAEHFLQRRLFPIERVAKEEDSQDKMEQVSASVIEVETPEQKFTLVRKDKDWVLKDAFKKKDKDWERVASEDRVDPAKARAILTGFPDLWAEKFVEVKDKSPADLGLKEPEYTLTITRPSGARSKLLVGKVSEKKTRVVTKPAPPPQFGMPPKQPPPEIVTEEYRYARLENSDRVFEVKGDKLPDLTPPLDVLRDPQLARFRTGDVKRIEIQVGDQQLVLAKIKEKEKDIEREKWRFEKPKPEEAETKPVEELLDKLSSLQARDKEILDHADLKAAGLDKPTSIIKLTVEEGKDEKKKKTRQIVFQIGTKEKEKDKAYVKVDAWPRVNQVSEEVLKLAQRPALAYRQRRVLDLAAGDVKKIEIERPEEKFTFERKADNDTDWKLASPVHADVQSSKVEGLADDLSKLEIVEFISEAPKQEDLDKTYGLAKPKLSVTFHAKDGKKTLAVGNPREGKQEYFARLDNGPVVAIKKDLRDELDRTSLSYRSLQLWQTSADAITEIQVQKGKDAYRLKKEGASWRITEPIQAEAMPIEVEEMAEALSRLKAERIEAHQAKDLAKFGLDKAAFKVQLTDAGKTRTIEIGKAADPAGKERYARVSDSDAIVVLGEKTITPFDRAALDLLDKTLLSVSPERIEKVRVKGESPFTLEPTGKDTWQVIDSPSPKFVAEEDAALGFLRPLSLLRAEKYVGYGSKIDWTEYGLDKPAATIELTLKPDHGDKKKATSHVIELGKESSAGERYARVDRREAVVLLSSDTADALGRTHLDFLDRRVLKFDSDALMGIKRTMKEGDIEIVKQEDQWRITKPSPARDADNLTMNDLLDKSFRLRAKRIHASPGKDLKSLGLDPPVAVVTLELDAAKHTIKVGNLARNKARKDTDERFALIDNNPAVVVLSAELSRHLTGSVLYYADRNLASLSGIDTVQVQRGPRKTEFKKPDDKWQMVAPVKSDAEDAALEELIRNVQRLRADEIVAEKDADVKKYGLDKPFMQLHFKSGDTSKLHLVVGAAESDKPTARRFARIGEKGPVFLMGQKLTAKAGEEFRGRKPWATFDAAQVERLMIVSPDKSITLQKKDAGWSVAGEDAKVDAAKVSDTLDALASLRALRYLADTKGDLALYGLAKPAWRVEVSTPTGKRELLVGRTEGTSQRYYASVAGNDAVFVIDEADAARIARPLSAFVIAEKKK